MGLSIWEILECIFLIKHKNIYIVLTAFDEYDIVSLFFYFIIQNYSNFDFFKQCNDQGNLD